jgi:hypothetical protein
LDCQFNGAGERRKYLMPVGQLPNCGGEELF